MPSRRRLLNEELKKLKYYALGDNVSASLAPPAFVSCPPALADGTLTTEGEVGDWDGQFSSFSGANMTLTFAAASQSIRAEYAASTNPPAPYCSHFRVPCNFGDATQASVSVRQQITTHEYTGSAPGKTTEFSLELVQIKSNGSDSLLADDSEVVNDGVTSTFNLTLSNITLNVPGSSAGGSLTWTDQVYIAVQISTSTVPVGEVLNGDFLWDQFSVTFA